MDQDKGIAVTNFTKKCYFPTSKGGGGGGQKQDELLEVLLTMKTDKESFVRKLTIEKENTAIVIASEEQLNNLLMFSTSEIDFCTVQIDPTFNLGPYECTPISYRNLMMKRKRTGKSPLGLAPVLIHYRKDQNTYSSFLQSLIDLKPALQGMLSTGTDGEQALVNAIEANSALFPPLPR